MTLWAEPYIGIPFFYGGRTREDGLDCWGLVRLIYRDIVGIDLPEYGEVSADDLRAVARTVGVKRDAEPWSMVLEPATYDIVVMGLHNKRIPAHVGLMVDENTMIHAEQSSHSCLVRLDNMTVRERVLGFRRHKTLL